MFKLTILKHQTWSMTRWWTNLHTHHCKSRWCGGQGISSSTFSQHQCSLTGVLPNYAHEGTTTATGKHIKFFDCTIVPEEKTYTTAHKAANSTFNATLWPPIQECILLHINLPKTQFCTPFIESWTRITIWLKPTFCNSIISIVQCTQGAECGAMEEGRPAKSLINLSVQGAWSNKTVERLDKNSVWTRAH
jgi:hypothetical protein